MTHIGYTTGPVYRIPLSASCRLAKTMKLDLFLRCLLDRMIPVKLAGRRSDRGSLLIFAFIALTTTGIVPVAGASTKAIAPRFALDSAYASLAPGSTKLEVVAINRDASAAVGQMELVVERQIGGGRWKRLGFVTRCQPIFRASACDLSRPLPPALGSVKAGTPVAANFRYTAPRTAVRLDLRLVTAAKNTYRFHVEVTRGGGAYVGQRLSNLLVLPTSNVDDMPESWVLDRIVANVNVRVDPALFFQKWDRESSSWVAVEATVPRADDGFYGGLPAGLYRACDDGTLPTCHTMLLTGTILSEENPVRLSGYGG